ncbi:hypothetical protein [Arachidicoccus terrestris]|uniref:hypothetical protein n=1 Tax=Arachidicoccus terrestris TaxID=2875539 RepID=UPI001CC77D01|nr:hypothetical protein [Arachidicoccus terrestris]UAY54788.1 hypothetical protein K9M52_15270 [Arachidicoccus terrestris]
MENMKAWADCQKSAVYIVATKKPNGEGWELSPLITSSNKAYKIYNRMLNFGFEVDLIKLFISDKYLKK